jgi:hypothetical protein
MRLNIPFHSQDLAHKSIKAVASRPPLLKLGWENFRLRGIKAFTLIETVAVIVVLSVLGLFTFFFVEYAIKTYLIGSKERMIYQEASYIMERITRELRDAEVAQPQAGGRELRIRQKSHLTPMDNNISDISFTWVGLDLVRTSNNVGRVMGTNVSGFTVTLLSGLSQCDDSTPNCYLAITLTLYDSSIPLAEVSAKTVTLRTTVSPKNLRTGYTGRCFNGDYEDFIQ